MRLWANEILFGPQLSKIKSTQAFINAYYVPSTVISVFHTLKKKILTAALFGKYYYSLYFTIEKTEAQEV